MTGLGARPPACPLRKDRSEFLHQIYDTNFSERQAGKRCTVLNRKKSDHVVCTGSEFGRARVWFIGRTEWGDVTAATIGATTTTGPSPPGIQGTRHRQLREPLLGCVFLRVLLSLVNAMLPRVSMSRYDRRWRGPGPRGYFHIDVLAYHALARRGFANIRPSCLTAVDRLKFAPGGVCSDIQVGMFARHIDTVPEGADAPLAKLQQRNETRSD